MQNDQLLSARRIRQPIQSEGDIKTAFDGITYQKGSAVINMFEQWIGPDKFQKGVHRYLTGHANGNATADDFLAAISADAGKDVAPAFNTFLNQPGLPLVTMKLACTQGKGHLEMTQYRYLPVGAKPSGAPHWQIPICVRTEKGPTCTLLVDPNGKLDLPSCPEWMMPNAASAGYYRSSLDDASLTKLMKNLGKLTPSEKMRAFYDVDASAHAGLGDYARTFELMGKLAGDKERHVVAALLPPVSFAREQMVTDDLAPKYAAFVRATFGARAHSLGFVEKKNEPIEARILRPQLLKIVGDEGGDSALRIEAQKLALRWFANHSVASPELAATALWLAAIDGDAMLYDRYLTAAKAEPERTERQRILGAMGHFRDPELVARGFQVYLGSDFDPREAYALVSGPAAYHATRDLAFTFAQKNFDAIVAKMPRDFGATVPRLGSGFCDEEHFNAMQSFFSARARTFAGGDRRLTQTLEEIQQCAVFKAKAQPSLTAFLSK
jgi:alanyl aminopeptidase